MIVVFDTNAVVEAIFWPRCTARRALTGLALRRFKTAVNQQILDEYVAVIAEIRGRLFPLTQPSGFGATEFDQGQITDYLSHGNLPPEQNVYDHTGYASAARGVVEPLSRHHIRRFPTGRRGSEPIRSLPPFRPGHGP